MGGVAATTPRKLVLVLAATAAILTLPPPATRAATRPAPRLFAFYSRVDGSLARLEQVGGRVTVLAPNWYALDTATATISGGAPDPHVMELSRTLGFAVWPVVNATIGRSALISTAAGRAKVLASITGLASRYRLAGVTLDMEEMAPEHRRPFTTLLRKLARELHRQKRRLAVYALRRTRTEVRVSAYAYDWPKLAAAADLLLASGYNEHGQSTGPGPVTTRHGFRQLADYAAHISRRKVAPTMGAFGYRWPAGGGRAELVPSGQAELRWPMAATVGDADGRHLVSGGDQIYYESAEDLWARERTVRAVGSRWIGLFSLGREPARFWPGSTLGRASLRVRR